MIEEDSVWVTGAWRSEPREVYVELVLDEEVFIRFLDTQQRSRCPLFAFTRIYEPLRLVAP